MDARKIMNFALVAALSILQLTRVDGVRTFIRSAQHDGRRCAGTQDFGTSSSVRQCFAQCERIPSCNSVSYDGLTQSCLGDFSITTRQATCTSDLGWMYYKAVDVVLGAPCTSTTDCPLQFSVCTSGTCQCDTIISEPAGPAECVLLSTYMFACTNDTDCMDTNTACWDGFCKCVPGYSHTASTNLCTDLCTNYGNTYQKYIDYDLNCQSSSDFHSDITIPACSSLCEGDPTCLSFSYHNGLTACQVRYCDPITNNPSDFGPYMEVDTYVRNCA